MSIPLLRPPITKEDIEAVTKQLEAGQLSGGKIVRDFEDAFAEYVGAPHCIAVDSLTSGFLAVLDMLGPSAASLPTATYVSMANTLKKMGVSIQFRDGWIAGNAYPILTDKGTIMDSAHALRRDICLQDKKSIWLFSFHATKLLATGKGGMIATFSKEQAEFLKRIVNNGRIYANNTFEFVVHNAGWNTYMSDIEASLGLSQLKRLDETNKRRDEVKKLYDKYLKSHPKDNWSRYIYQVWIENFPAFYQECEKRQIQVSKHFNPIHLQPAFFTRGSFPQATEAAAHLISIPFWADMSEEQIKTVSELVNQWRSNAKT